MCRFPLGIFIRQLDCWLVPFRVLVHGVNLYCVILFSTQFRHFDKVVVWLILFSALANLLRRSEPPMTEHSEPNFPLFALAHDEKPLGVGGSSPVRLMLVLYFIADSPWQVVGCSRDFVGQWQCLRESFRMARM